MAPAHQLATVILGHSLSSNLPNVTLWKANIYLIWEPKINLGIGSVKSRELMPILQHGDTTERLQNEDSKFIFSKIHHIEWPTDTFY